VERAQNIYLNNYLCTVNQLRGAYLIVFLSTTALPLRDPASAKISDSCRVQGHDKRDILYSNGHTDRYVAIEIHVVRE